MQNPDVSPQKSAKATFKSHMFALIIIDNVLSPLIWLWGM